MFQFQIEFHGDSFQGRFNFFTRWCSRAHNKIGDLWDNHWQFVGKHLFVEFYYNLHAMNSRDAASVISIKRNKPAFDAPSEHDYKRRKFIDFDNRMQFRCCEKCNAMTGTREGLQMLLDTDGDGYEHYNWQEMHTSRSIRCQLYDYICYSTGGDDWGEEWIEGEGEINMDKVRVYAITNHAVDKSLTHPLDHRVGLEALRFQFPGNPPIYRNLKLVAIDGMNYILCLLCSLA